MDNNNNSERKKRFKSIQLRQMLNKRKFRYEMVLVTIPNRFRIYKNKNQAENDSF